MYSEGTEGVPQNAKKALELYRVGCSEGNQQSCSVIQGQVPTETAAQFPLSTSGSRYQLPSTPKPAFANPAPHPSPIPAVVVDPHRQAELQQMAESIDRSSIWAGYPNCKVLLHFLPIAPSTSSLDAVDNVPCGESLEVLRQENKFYLVRAKRGILGYVPATAISSTP